MENTIVIEGLDALIEEVKEIERLKKEDAAYTAEDSIPPVILDGEPKMIVGNEYMPVNEAQVIFQKRAVVREYLKLLDFEAKVKKDKE